MSAEGILLPNRGPAALLDPLAEHCPYGPRHPVEHQQVLAEMRRVRQGCRDMGYDRVIAGARGTCRSALKPAPKWSARVVCGSNDTRPPCGSFAPTTK